MKANFGERIRKYRKKRSLSQKELAKLINVDVCTISLYERGKFNPSASAVVKLANVLGITTDALLMDETSKEAEKLLRDKDLLYFFTLVEKFSNKDKR